MDLQFLYNQAKEKGYLDAEKAGAQLSKQFILSYIEKVSDDDIKKDPRGFILNLLKLATNTKFNNPSPKKTENKGKLEICSHDQNLQEKVNGYKQKAQNSYPPEYQDTTSTVARGLLILSIVKISDIIVKDENLKEKYITFAKNLKKLINDIDKHDSNIDVRTLLKESGVEPMLHITTNIIATILYPICPKAFPLTNDYISPAVQAFDKRNKETNGYQSLEKLRVNNDDITQYIEFAERLEKELYPLFIDEKDEKDFGVIDKIFHMYVKNYDIANIDSPNTIFYGAPGTGKTYEVSQKLKFIEGVEGENGKVVVKKVQFHPSFTYEDFIEGIKPKGIDKNGNVKLEMVNGVFKQFCIEANKGENRDKKYFFVVDEINRANLSSVFGETLSLLEGTYRHKQGTKENLINTQYSSLIDAIVNEDPRKEAELVYARDENGDVAFGIPDNVFFIGMMNDVDKSIDTFDLALRRRFKWEHKGFEKDVLIAATKFESKSENKKASKTPFTNIEKYAECALALNKYICDSETTTFKVNDKNFTTTGLGLGSSYEFGHSFFMRISLIANRKEISEANLDNLFKHYLRPTLKEYLRAFYSENEIESKLKEALEVFKQPIKGTDQDENNSSD